MHEPSASVWLLDSGCSNHMTSNKNLFANFDQTVKRNVKLGIDKTMEVDGKGVVNILTKQGEPKIISEEPPGYEVEGNEDKVYRSKKSLYGLKKAPRAWYSRIDSYLIKNVFCRSNIEPTLCTKVNEHGHILIVCLYIDDMIFTGDFEIDEFKVATMKEFEMIDIGLMKYFLGIEIDKSKKGIFICQNKHAKDLSKRFRMENCKPVPMLVAIGTKLSKDYEGSDVKPTLFKRLVDNLMYLIVTRLDIIQGVSLISIFMETPKDTHWSAGKRILRYITGTRDCGIMYASTEKKDLIGYIDSDFAGSLDDRKSTSCFAFHLGSGVSSRASKKQPIVTLSLVESKYVAATSTSCQAVWLRRVFDELQ
eukprot:PITA_06398